MQFDQYLSKRQLPQLLLAQAELYYGSNIIKLTLARSPMHLTDFFAMLCAPDDWTSFLAWKQAFLRDNPDFEFQLQDRVVPVHEAPDHWLLNHFRSDRTLSKYWKTPLGRLNHWIVLFWARVKRPEFRNWLWRLSWAWKTRGSRQWS